ncbi:hypothetical protein [Streptomyces sp. PT12]|uniref:hypothetical protein n=1 Tax=Streptomyces sp. PT12 TaxID=1510197 RepID=UPI00215D2DCB|nr:hypothetical protein [Streptomyces sp. PT12]
MTEKSPALRPNWRRALGGAASAGALVVALTACGADEPEPETNGVDELPAAEIEERARAAAAEASSVRLSGTVITEAGTFRLDVRLGGEGGVGEVSTEGTTFELLRIGDDLYIKADQTFWESEGIPDELETDPTEKLDGKYVRVVPDDPAYEQLSGFTDKNTLLDGLLTLDGERATGEEGEIDGSPTIRVEADGGAGGVIEVALMGTPYPLRLERGGAAGQLTLDDWGQEFSLNEPKEDEIVDYGDALINPEE